MIWSGSGRKLMIDYQTCNLTETKIEDVFEYKAK